MKKTLSVLLLGLLAAFPGLCQDYHWYKGNTHCHTLTSDGDEFPRRVVRWYRDHGYNFIAITDHNKVTEIKYLDTDPHDDFILIQGEEVDIDHQEVPIHVNALNTPRYIEAQDGNSITDTLQINIQAVREAGAVPQINHPNWKWSFTDEEMSQLTDVTLFELYNVTHDSNNFGAGGRPGMEEIWDRMLSRGKVMYGIACDDAHYFLGDFTQGGDNPGAGWIMVKARELTPDSIVTALEQGDFYASVGVILEDVIITEKEYIVEIEPFKDNAYTTSFIGKEGKILQEVFGLRAVYSFQGDELYVRARVFSSSGAFACTQPIFRKKSD